MIAVPVGRNTAETTQILALTMILLIILLAD